MDGAMWLVSCGCGANEEFELYREARGWQDAHDSACERRTDLWAPDFPQEARPQVPRASPPLAAPQALSLAHA